jgi:hypothetical protein
MQCRGALTAARVTAHQHAPALFVERIEPKQVLRMLDGIRKRAILFERIDKVRQDLLCAPPNTLTVGVNPLTLALRQQVALIKTCGFLQGGSVPTQAAIGGGFEIRHVDGHSGLPAPRQQARAGIDKGLQLRPVFPQVVQFAAEIGQRLDLARFRPQGPGDALTRDRPTAVEDQEGEDLLQPHARRAGSRAAIAEQPESAEKLDA